MFKRLHTCPLCSLSYQTQQEWIHSDDFCLNSYRRPKGRILKQMSEGQQFLQRANKSTGTHSFRRCSKSPSEEGMKPLSLLSEMSLDKMIVNMQTSIADYIIKPKENTYLSLQNVQVAYTWQLNWNGTPEVVGREISIAMTRKKSSSQTSYTTTQYMPML